MPLNFRTINHYTLSCLVCQMSSLKYINRLFIIYSPLFISLCSSLWHIRLCFFFFHLVFILPQSYTISAHISFASPSINCLCLLFLLLSPSLPRSLFPGGLPFVIDPCPGCLGIDWLSPCHWSSLSILTRFGHPLCCGQRVGDTRDAPRHREIK